MIIIIYWSDIWHWSTIKKSVISSIFLIIKLKISDGDIFQCEKDNLDLNNEPLNRICHNETNQNPPVIGWQNWLISNYNLPIVNIKIIIFV